jgi:2-polyprenyl-3-methyl-5-hydroxy-6-metoxy-1,4-benzoquinol methylase
MTQPTAAPVAPAFDQARADAFADRLLAALNGGALGLLVSVGHRTGLFDALAEMPSATSEELAQAARLDERYVREWLGGMLAGGVVTYDRATARFALPPEHAASLTRAATPGNMAVFAQYLAVLGSVEDQVVECFRHGGGVPYAAFDRFHEVMAEDSGQTVLPALEDAILPLVPGLTEALEAGIDVLDVGCGSGRAMNQLASAFPTSRFVGYDVSEEAIARARAEAAQRGATNVRFEVRDVTDLGEEEAYDLVTAFDAIHDQVHPDQVLRSIRAALRPTGTFLMQDIHASSDVAENRDHPLGPFLYTISTMHCMTVSLSAGGAGLGTCWGEECALGMLSGAGFAHVEVKQLEHDIQNSFYVAR